MTEKQKSSPAWVCERERYQDFELDFPYSVIHRVRDTDYLTGGLSSALAEWRVFKDAESFAYFIAVLMQAKVLIPVHFLPSYGRPSSVTILHTKRGELESSDEYCNIGAVDLVPKTSCVDETGREFLAIFTSIREISKTPLFPEAPHPLVVQQPQYTYLYIEFSRVYEWLKKHKSSVDDVIFDLLSKDYKQVGMTVDAFLETIDRFQTVAQEYTGKNLLHDLMMASLAKHAPKSRRKK